MGRLIDVHGSCPMGCGRTLHLASDSGMIACTAPGCPRPSAVTDLLQDRETEHVVTFTEEGFTLRHPLKERLDEALMECDLHEELASLSWAPVPPGRYRASRWPDQNARRWAYIELPSES